MDCFEISALFCRRELSNAVTTIFLPHQTHHASVCMAHQVLPQILKTMHIVRVSKRVRLLTMLNLQAIETFTDSVLLQTPMSYSDQPVMSAKWTYQAMEFVEDFHVANILISIPVQFRSCLRHACDFCVRKTNASDIKNRIPVCSHPR